MSTSLTAIGMMSGTSMDGVDAAIIESDGETINALGPTLFREYLAPEREAIAAAMDYATRSDPAQNNWRDHPILAAAMETVTRAHLEAIESIVQVNKLSCSDIDLIGFHGQTVLHRPDISLTVQLGDAQAIADKSGIRTVYDMRQADMAAGGQGAPLAPVYHRALVDGSDFPIPVAVLNIGGITNVTWIGADDAMIAFDTGPGNVLLDEWMKAKTGLAMDLDGAAAKRGHVNAQILDKLLENSYFRQKPPKSLDRLDFSTKPAEGLSTEDGAATLTSFTAASIALAADHFPDPVNDWIVTGGGALNPILLSEMTKRLTGNVIAAPAIGWSDTFIEAQAFGYMAVRSVKGLPLTFPGTTGVSAPLTGGVLATPVRR
jgi:anhydro-N-acetylmuramic acid kinase